MTSTGKIVVGIVVVVLIIAAGAFYWLNRSSSALPGSTSQNPSAQTAQTGGTEMQTSSTDTSDKALTQDEANIDAQMSGLQSDNTDVTNSLNAQ